jgi:hypothetical protein
MSGDDAGMADVAVEDGRAEGGGTIDARAGDCAYANEQVLKPIDAVSTGEVVVLAESSDVRTVYVDASAGGTQAASTHPRLYLNLETATRVGVTDKTAAFSVDWDLAIKRPILFTNSGDGGSGRAGAILLAGQDFDAVTSVDATGKTFAKESFFESDCTPKLDPTGAVKTSFDGWYDYDEATNVLAPHAGTWLVWGATGKVYKVQILSYYGAPDGGIGQSGGRYLLQIGAL